MGCYLELMLAGLEFLNLLLLFLRMILILSRQDMCNIKDLKKMFGLQIFGITNFPKIKCEFSEDKL